MDATERRAALRFRANLPYLAGAVPRARDEEDRARALIDVVGFVGVIPVRWHPAEGPHDSLVCVALLGDERIRAFPLTTTGAGIHAEFAISTRAGKKAATAFAREL
jgi:hypothetical protein